MAKYPVAGYSYIEVDDAGGIPRNLSPYIEEIEPLGRAVSFVDVTGLNDPAQRVIAGAEPPRSFPCTASSTTRRRRGRIPLWPASWGKRLQSATARRGSAPAGAKSPGSSSASATGLPASWTAARAMAWCASPPASGSPAR